VATYEIQITPTAVKQLASLPAKIRGRIDKKILALAKEPRPHQAKPLQGKIKDLFRLRVGDYRIVYQVRDVLLIVLVIRIGHRREVYRGL
jgi:mRNA interferase RelE/StbE